MASIIAIFLVIAFSVQSAGVARAIDNSPTASIRPFYAAIKDSTDKSYFFDAIVYEQGGLYECRSAKPTQNSGSPTPHRRSVVVSLERCVDVSGRLQSPEKFFCQKEHQAFQGRQKDIAMEEKLSPFCLDLENSYAPVEPKGEVIHTANGRISRFPVDLNNDGKADTVFQVKSDAKFFNGAYLLVFTGSESGVGDFFPRDAIGKYRDPGGVAQKKSTIRSGFAPGSLGKMVGEVYQYRR